MRSAPLIFPLVASWLLLPRPSAANPDEREYAIQTGPEGTTIVVSFQGTETSSYYDEALSVELRPVGSSDWTPAGGSWEALGEVPPELGDGGSGDGGSGDAGALTFSHYRQVVPCPAAGEWEVALVTEPREVLVNQQVTCTGSGTDAGPVADADSGLDAGVATDGGSLGQGGAPGPGDEQADAGVDDQQGDGGPVPTFSARGGRCSLAAGNATNGAFLMAGLLFSLFLIRRRRAA